MGSVLVSPSFNSFAFYSSILAFKMLAMSGLTSLTRIFRHAFVNPEDLEMINRAFGRLPPKKQTSKSSKSELVTDDPHVERLRRAHLNDLENILPFFIIGFLYCCTRPDPYMANGIFFIYTISRVIHTLVYAFFPVKQPTRVLTFFVGMGINLFMTSKVMSHFL